MTFRLILFGILSLTTAYSHESESVEINRLEFSPYYDTIIFSDVADIINDFENNINPLDIILGSASESEETIEDLLAEYQHYIDKAHKQRQDYLEKTKAKNKVPTTRHDRFSKLKQAAGTKYDDYYYSNGFIGANKLSPMGYNPPLDFVIPVNSKFRYLNKLDPVMLPKDNQEPPYEKRMLELPPAIPKSRFEPIKSPCFCKSGQFPCECKCKQCLFPMDSLQPNLVTHNLDTKGLLTNVDYATEDRMRDMADNTLNVRIKVDIQFPKISEVLGKSLKNRSRDDIAVSKESSVNLPFPYFNFPIPMDLFGYKKSSRFNNHDSPHKITIHKKKKSRPNSGNKKHRKKVITFHNLNMQPQSPKLQTNFEDVYNSTYYHVKLADNINFTVVSNITTSSPVTTKLEDNVTTTNPLNTTKPTPIYNETQTEENIYLIMNISNGGDNITEDVHKIENDVETEFTKPDYGIPTERQLKIRLKRESLVEQSKYVPPIPEIPKSVLPIYEQPKPVLPKFEQPKTVLPKFEQQDIEWPKVDQPKIVQSGFRNASNISNVFDSDLTKNTPLVKNIPSVESTANNDILVRKIPIDTKVMTTNRNVTKFKLNDSKKNDKSLLVDSELVYWPTNQKQEIVVSSRNITTIILDRENRKAKINMTKETLRLNHIQALEKAIFGDVNWDDVDTVAPVFLSFVGKYLRGILTFCSQKLCHSMKCADKTCIHRTCIPDDRWNHRGHCAGSNSTDSIASLESILDLPSNVAFEIVDILQEKMLGKLFGKVTLCISAKCISFVACKKNFLKSKCSVKDLKTGHCPNIKTFKIM